MGQGSKPGPIALRLIADAVRAAPETKPAGAAAPDSAEVRVVGKDVNRALEVSDERKTGFGIWFSRVQHGSVDPLVRQIPVEDDLVPLRLLDFVAIQPFFSKNGFDSRLAAARSVAVPCPTAYGA
jgi:hypothetical protein